MQRSFATCLVFRSAFSPVIASFPSNLNGSSVGMKNGELRGNQLRRFLENALENFGGISGWGLVSVFWSYRALWGRPDLPFRGSTRIQTPTCATALLTSSSLLSIIQSPAFDQTCSLVRL